MFPNNLVCVFGSEMVADERYLLMAWLQCEVSGLLELADIIQLIKVERMVAKSAWVQWNNKHAAWPSIGQISKCLNLIII